MGVGQAHSQPIIFWGARANYRGAKLHCLFWW